VAELGKAEVLGFVNQLKPHDHAIMFYTYPEDKQLVLFSYIKTILEEGGGVVYFFSQISPTHIAITLKQFGIAADKYMQKGAFRLVDQGGQYFFNVGNNLQQSIDSIKNAYNELTAKGFKKIIIIEDMAFFLAYGMVDYLIKYERLLQKALEIPAITVCVYDFELLCKQGNGDLYLNLIKSHSIIILAGPKEWEVKVY
jgi:hypothetical protein